MNNFNRLYFDGGRGNVGGYSGDGYMDFPVHNITVEKLLSYKPESVLELGCAKGYIIKRLEDAGVKCTGLEISTHCFLTRATDSVKCWDITQTPWPINDQEFDMCFSQAVLEHIPEDKLPNVISEIKRTTRRGIHGVDFGEHDDGFDKTHCTLKGKEWWIKLFPSEQIIIDKEELETGVININSDNKLKLNIGCHKIMFHTWQNIDILPLSAWAAGYGYPFHQLDVKKGIPYRNNCVDNIYTSHFLEHLTYDEGLAFLKDCYRVMKPGAIIRISVPNLAKLTTRYANNELSYYDELSDECSNTKSDARKLWALLCGGHSAIYDWPLLCDVIKNAGFNTVYQSTFNDSKSSTIKTQVYDMFPDISLYVEAIK